MTPIPTKTLGERIKELRDKKDLSLRELGKKLGNKSAAFLSDIELGRRFPSDDVLAELARVLGTTVEDLKQHDTRAPLEEMRRAAASHPLFGFAFRQVLESRKSPEELIEFAKSQRKGTKKP